MIGSLRVFTDETADKSVMELPTQSLRYKTVQSILNLGICLLETPAGRQSLVTVATEVIKACRNSKRHYDIYGDRSLNEMPRWVDRFLDDLRLDFPHVYLEFIRGDAYTYRKPEPWGKNMEDFEPKVAADLCLQKCVLSEFPSLRRAALTCIAGHQQPHSCRATKRQRHSRQVPLDDGHHSGSRDCSYPHELFDGLGASGNPSTSIFGSIREHRERRGRPLLGISPSGRSCGVLAR